MYVHVTVKVAALMFNEAIAAACLFVVCVCLCLLLAC